MFKKYSIDELIEYLKIWIVENGDSDKTMSKFNRKYNCNVEIVSSNKDSRQPYHEASTYTEWRIVGSPWRAVTFVVDIDNKQGDIAREDVTCYF